MTFARTTTNQSLLSRVNWQKVGRMTQRELHNRELYAPVVSTYRWWARRPHSVMGALLDAAVDRFGQGLTVSDPFCGGGTVTFEATRRGLRAYAQDLYSWPTRGLATALNPADPRDFEAAAQQLLAVLEPQRDNYRTPDGRELSHVIRVRATACNHCGHDYFLFPQPLISVLTRSPGERNAYFGCSGCGAIAKRKRTIARFRCTDCGLVHPTSKSFDECPHCGEPHISGPHGMSAGRWCPVLVQEVVLEDSLQRARLRPVRPDDPILADAAVGLHPSLEAPIPPGVETKRLLDAGFTRWGELYTARQATVLVRALEYIKRSANSPAIKDRLALAVLGAAEMPSFVSRWDRFHLKPFEGMANHRYSSGTLVVECNPISPVGRGTLARRLGSAGKALAWLVRTCATQPKVVSTKANAVGRRPTNWDVLVTTGSSCKQTLQDSSVNITLTDPPYHDDVQYGELARLFHAWLSVYIPVDEVDERQEAVPNSVRGTSSDAYEKTIAACLTESRRALKPDGCLVLTFHNKRFVAWRALASALQQAGFSVRALAVVRSENGNDHCKRDVNALLHDLVIECVPKARINAKVSLEFSPRTLAEKNLAAVGLALAACVESGHCEQMEQNHQTNLAKLRATTNLIG